MEAVEGLHKTIDRQDALIRQLGEALEDISKFIPTSSAADGGASRHSANVIAADKVRNALAAYRKWKAGQP